MRYAEYEVVLIKDIILKNILNPLWPWEKGQYKVMVKIEGEKHIYIIPDKHFYQYLR